MKVYYIWSKKRTKDDNVCVFAGKRGYVRDLDKAARFTKDEVTSKECPVMTKRNYRKMLGTDVSAVAVECCDIHLLGRVIPCVILDQK